MKRLLHKIAVAATAALAISGIALPASAAQAHSSSNTQIVFCVDDSYDYTAPMDFYIVGPNQNDVWTTSPTNRAVWNVNNGCYYLANWWWQIGYTVEVHYDVVGKKPWKSVLFYLSSSNVYEDYTTFWGTESS